MKYLPLRKPTLVALIALFAISAGALAGSLTPPGAVGSTMNSLADLYASIAGSFNSTSITSDQNGSLIQNLKYIEANIPAAFRGMGIREDANPFSHITSVSFEGNMFNISNTASASTVRLDWTNGPASRSASQTITGLWTFSGGATVSAPFEVTGYASLSNTLWVSPPGSLGFVGIGSSSPQAFLSVKSTSTTNTNPLMSVASASGTNYFTVTKGGNVGIGTSTPTTKLNVAGGSMLMSQQNPVQIASVSDGQSFVSVALSGNYAFVSNGTLAATQIYDIAVPSSPRLLTTFSRGCGGIIGINGRTISGNRIVINCSASAVRIYDFSNIASPSLLSTLPTAQVDFPAGIAISGRYLYITQDFGVVNLGIFDISDPRNPRKLATTFLGSGDRMRGVDVVGNYLYAVSFQTNKFRIFDISDPTNPMLKSTTTLTGAVAPQSVVVDNGYAYINGNTIKIYDVSNVASPSAVGSIAHGSFGDKVAPAGHYLYAPILTGLQVYDVSVPSSPVLAGSTLYGGSATGRSNVALQGKYAFVTSAGRGFRVYDISGIDVPGISGGSLAFKNADITGYVSVGNLIVRSGLSARSGFDSQMPSSVYASTSASTVLRINQSLTGGVLDLVGNAVTTGSIASLSATSLAGGSVFNITVPASSSANNPHGLMLVQNVNGLTIASWSMGGALSLAGAIRSDGAVSNCTGVNTPSSGCIDYAESYPTTDGTLQAGELVSIDPHNSQHVIRASSDPIGIVSTNPAALIDANGLKTGSLAKSSLGTVPVALAGRVPVKITGHVSAGDHLTISSTPGTAQTATTAGTTIGIALEDSDGPTVMTFVNTSYWAPSVPVVAQGIPDSQSLIDIILNYLKDAVLTVRRLVVHDEVCIGETCVNENQLKALLQNASVPTDTPTPSDTPAPSDVPTPDPTEISSTP